MDGGWTRLESRELFLARLLGLGVVNDLRWIFTHFCWSNTVYQVDWKAFGVNESYD